MDSTHSSSMESMASISNSDDKLHSPDNFRFRLRLYAIEKDLNEAQNKNEALLAEIKLLNDKLRFFFQCLIMIRVFVLYFRRDKYGSPKSNLELNQELSNLNQQVHFESQRELCEITNKEDVLKQIRVGIHFLNLKIELMSLLAALVEGERWQGADMADGY